MWRPWSAEENNSVQFENSNNTSDSDGEVRNDAHKEEGATEKRKRIILSPDAKELILNVYHTLREDGINDLVSETARLTKIPYSSVWKIINYGFSSRQIRRDKGMFRKLREEEHAHVVRRIIYDSFNENVVPTLRTLQQDVLKVTRISVCIETLRKFLLKIGFHHETIDKKNVLMESRTISEWRYKYLTEVKKRREDGKTIIYLDETWFHSYDTVKKGWVDKSKKCVLNVPAGKGHRIIILHAGSKDGWVKDGLLLSARNIKNAALDYHDDMCGEIFMDWFCTKLLPNVPKNCVIVMDNASYHSVQKFKIPNSNSRKAELMEFLELHDLYFEENYTKKQLLEVLKTKEFSKQYKVDEEAMKAGYEVLRLPPYHCIFNPIEMIWSQLKQNLRRNNQNPKFSEHIIDLIKTEVSKISAVEWSNCERHVIDIENMYREKQVKPLIIEINSDNDSSDDGMCDSDCDHD